MLPQSWIAADTIDRYIAAVHEKGGEEVADKIWEETLQELSFADVQGILDRL